MDKHWQKMPSSSDACLPAVSSLVSCLLGLRHLIEAARRRGSKRPRSASRPNIFPCRTRPRGWQPPRLAAGLCQYLMPSA